MTQRRPHWVYDAGSEPDPRFTLANGGLFTLAGLVLLAIVSPFALHTDLLMTGGLTTVVMIVVAVWESVSRRRLARARS